MPTPAVLEPAPGSLTAGRYLLGERLKHGHGVNTFRAQDVTTSQAVVVKTIDPQAIHAAARLRFEHETRVLRTLTGAGLTGLHDAGVCDGMLFLVQPLVPGDTLEHRLRRGPVLLTEALQIALSVANALDAAHEVGICHRDVKPANVIVDGHPLTSATLIDFGFARSPWLDESIRDDLVGTVRYLAPESAGLLAVPADERSDLYALGVMLFECLAGRPPFEGPDVGDLLRQHLSAPVPPLRELGVRVPRAVEGILQRLLCKEPGDRYQFAGALAADLQSLLDALSTGDDDPPIVVGRFDRRRSLTDPAFVGREAELTALRTTLTGVTSGAGCLVQVEADSGGGKSRLLTELLLQSGDLGTVLLRGQGVAQAAQRPFTLLQGVARDLVEAFREDEAGRRALVERLGDAGPTAVRALPELAPLLGVAAEADTGPEQFGEQRSIAALHRLMTSVATPERPVVVVLDDCQWADGLTLRLLTELYGAASTAPPYLAVITAFRSEEVPSGHPLRAIAQGATIALGPLAPDSVRQLAESMAGPLPADIVATLVRLSDGSPFMVSAVLRGLVECGALVAEPEGWAVVTAALEDVQTARRSAVFLVRRLELLSPAAVALLSAGAVLGKEFDVEVALQLVQADGDGAGIVEEARRRRLLWVDERTGRCSFFHDKIREALLERLDAEHRQDLHGLAADALLGREDDERYLFELAYHLDAAGRHALALPYALRAAIRSREQHALESAVSHYRFAARAVPESGIPARVQIAEGLGDVLTLQGVYGEARDQLSLARGLVADRVHEAALEGKLGDLAFKQGDVPTARHHLEGAMRLLGRRVPHFTPVLLGMLLWELLVQATHTVLPRLTTGRRRPADDDGPETLAMRLYSRLAYLYWFHSGKVPCAWVHLRGMNLAERYPPSPELGQAWSEHAPALTMLPWFSRALGYVQRSLRLRLDLGDMWGQGQSRGFAGVALYAASRYDEAAEACREARRLLAATGDRWEAGTAGWNLALCHYRRGDLRDASDVARQIYVEAREIGDVTSAGVALSVWTRADAGRVDAQLIKEELDHGSEDASTTAELQLAAALHALVAEDLDEARRYVDDAVTTIHRAGLRQEYAASAFPWRATVLRRLVEAAPAHSPGLRRRRLRAASRAVFVARLWAFSYRNNAPHALREAGLITSLRGRTRAADRLLDRSLAVAEAQGAKYEAALSRLAQAELGLARGGSPVACRQAQAAVDALRVQDIDVATPADPSASVSMFDRFTTLLSAGRDITAAPTITALETATREAALALLRGEHCHLVAVSALDTDHLVSQSGESVDAVSRTLLAQAVSSGAPVVAADPAVDESESLLLSGIRSVIAAPIMVHGRVHSCFYVTHRQIGRLYGEEEVQLAAFVATLAGAAYEHLDGLEARFRSLAQHSSDVLTLVNLDGLVHYQSSSVTRVFDLPEQALIGSSVAEWVHPQDVGRFRAALALASREEEVRVECRFRHADGSYRFAETAVTNLLDDPHVGSLVLNTRDVTDRRSLEDELRERALHDELTGLPNRALFRERLDQALAAPEVRPFAAFFLDLDDFKTVNDTLGHGAGDALLVMIAERLQQCVRPHDTVARFGGDEFAILLEDTDLATAVTVAERILESTATPLLLGDREVIARTSIGITTWTTGDGDVEQLLAQADAAMYAAKARGAHRYAIYDPGLRLATERRSRLRKELEHALGAQELRLHFQPIMQLSTNRRLGVEALVRWQHPERGLLPPAEFIDFAEESGQIIDIGTWVLAAACQATPTLGPDAHMSVNVSGRQLQQPDLLARVSEALAASGLPPHRLVLEITETAAVADLRGAIARLTELKGLGVKLALDDFGTGYSPLSHLRRFPVDFLKIDRSFVQGVAINLEDRAIVRGVIEMAHALDLETIAEGIEDADQREVLTELGCDLGQGYLWMKPGPLESLPPVGLPVPRTSIDRPARDDAPTAS